MSELDHAIKVCLHYAQHEHEARLGSPERSPGSDISRGPALELPRPEELALRSCTALLYTLMPCGRASPAQAGTM